MIRMIGLTGATRAAVSRRPATMSRRSCPRMRTPTSHRMPSRASQSMPSRPSLVIVTLLMLASIAAISQCANPPPPSEATNESANAHADPSRVQPRPDSSGLQHDQSAQVSRMARRASQQQQFRIHLLGPSKPKLMKLRRRSLLAAAASPEHQSAQSLATNKDPVGPGSAGPMDESVAQVQRQSSKKASIGKKMNSLALKKLLNQTFQDGKHSAANGGVTNATTTTTTTSGKHTADNQQPAIKSSNFKLVFIKRAPAPSHPQASASGIHHNQSDSTITRMISTPPTIVSSSSSVSSSAPSLPTTPAPGVAQTATGGTPASKSLASSMLQTVANHLINAANLSSTSISVPFLSSRIATTTSMPSTPASSTQSGPSSSSVEPTTGPKNSEQAEDIRRVSIGWPASDSGAQPMDKQQPKGGRNMTKLTKGMSKKARPSKVYNLPIKFISNGQPDNIVLQAFKQHFATIRRLQTATKSTGKSSSRPTTSSNGGDKRAHGRKKLKGTNSRLIYLPLKYLNNGRPSGLIITKGKTSFHRSQIGTN